MIVQVFLVGVQSCMQWRESQTALKIITLTNVLINDIKSQCQCNYSISQLYQPHYECLNNHSDRIAFRVHVITYSNLTVKDLVQMVETFIRSQTSIYVQGDLLEVDQNCPVEAESGFECYSTTSRSISITIIGVSLAATLSICIIILCCFVLLIYSCITSNKKQNR